MHRQERLERKRLIRRSENNLRLAGVAEIYGDPDLGEWLRQRAEQNRIEAEAFSHIPPSIFEKAKALGARMIFGFQGESHEQDDGNLPGHQDNEEYAAFIFPVALMPGYIVTSEMVRRADEPEKRYQQRQREKH